MGVRARRVRRSKRPAASARRGTDPKARQLAGFSCVRRTTAAALEQHLTKLAAVGPRERVLGTEEIEGVNEAETRTVIVDAAIEADGLQEVFESGFPVAVGGEEAAEFVVGLGVRLIGAESGFEIGLVVPLR